MRPWQCWLTMAFVGTMFGLTLAGFLSLVGLRGVWTWGLAAGAFVWAISLSPAIIRFAKEHATEFREGKLRRPKRTWKQYLAKSAAKTAILGVCIQGAAALSGDPFQFLPFLGFLLIGFPFILLIDAADWLVTTLAKAAWQRMHSRA